MSITKHFWEIITKRRSVRAFQDKDISDDVLKKILKAAYVAPRGSQEKSWDFIIIRNNDFKLKMQATVKEKATDLVKKIPSERQGAVFQKYSNFFTFFTKAPVIVIVVQKEYKSLLVKILQKIETPKFMENITMVGTQNVAAAIQNILLACEAEGVGTCWMTGPMIAQEELCKLLELNETEKIAAILPMGYPKGNPAKNNLPSDEEINFRCI